MLSRFFLVGIVATLGITIPSWDEVCSWVSVVHEWTARGLASMDAPGRHVDHPVFVAWIPEGSRLSFTPIEPEDRAAGIADSLNQISEGLDAVPLVAVTRRRPATRRAQPPELPSVPALDTIEGRIIAELIEAVARQQIDGVSGMPRIAEIPHRTARGITCVQSRSTKVAEPASAAKDWEPIDPPVGSNSDVALALDRFAEEIHPVPTPSRQPVPAEVEQVFEGLPFAGPALVVEGPRGPVPAKLTLHPSRADAPPEVARAIGLTGEAMRAWMRVLSGPANVQVSAR